MGKTSIEWTRGDDGSAGMSWNVVSGCEEVSPGCANCYSCGLCATRLRHHPDYKGVANRRNSLPRWTGKLRLLHDRLTEPMKWKKPRRIFVCDMADLFHRDVPFEFIDHVWATMANCERHTFLVLTKRPEQMREYLASRRRQMHWPLPNVWCGTSVENQTFADRRIPELEMIPAVVRFLSIEPLLGPVTIAPWPASIDWIIVGGESGPRARPMHPAWAQTLRDQCQAAGIPFFFKQWGAWRPTVRWPYANPKHHDGFRVMNKFGRVLIGGAPQLPEPDDPWWFEKLGKKKAGRLLDGREWNEFPLAVPRAE